MKQNHTHIVNADDGNAASIDNFQEMIDCMSERFNDYSNKETSIDRLKVSAPLASPTSNYSSSSEADKKLRKRHCRTCNIRFKKTSLLHQHLKEMHVQMPVIELERLADCTPDQSASSVMNQTNGDGLKMKLKCSTGVNFEVVSNTTPTIAPKVEVEVTPDISAMFGSFDESNIADPLMDSELIPPATSSPSVSSTAEPRIRVLSDKEIKQSPATSNDGVVNAVDTQEV